MRAHARLDVERTGGRDVVRTLVSAAPLTLIPDRVPGPATVHLVNSAAAPLGGDDLLLTVTVGPGAHLRLVGVAATLALPGVGASRTRVDVRLAEGARFDHLAEPTVVTRRADHHAVLTVEMAGSARLRTRETLVLGRAGEPPGRLTTETHVLRAGVPLLRQRLDLGDPVLDAATAGLAGHRVLASELLVGHDPLPAPATGPWWSLVHIGPGAALATALAHDSVTARRDLATALGEVRPAVGDHATAGR